MTVVFMFPSQTSRYAGMLQKIVGLRPGLARVLERASDALGEDLRARFLNDDPDTYREKRDQRLGMFLANHIYQLALEEAGVEADLSLGFSLGEYNHLVHIGALELETALELLLRPAPPGQPDPDGERAIVYRISLAELERRVERGRERGIVEIGCMISPHVHLIVGEPEPVHWVLARLKEEKPRSRSITFPVKLPLHSTLLEPVGKRFAAHLETLQFPEPHLPYLPNVLGELVERPTQRQMVDLMSRHLYQPVRWRQSIDHIVEHYPDAVFVEVGPRRALCAFFYFEKTWHPKTKYYITDSMKVPSDRYLRNVADKLAWGGGLGVVGHALAELNR